MVLAGLQLSVLKPMDAEQALDYVSALREKHNINALEIDLDGSSGQPAIFHYKKESKELFTRRLVDFKSVGVHLPFLYLNPIADYSPIAQKSMAELKLCIDYASDINANYVVFHADGFSHFKDRKKIYDAWEMIISGLLEHAVKKILFSQLKIRHTSCHYHCW